MEFQIDAGYEEWFGRLDALSFLHDGGIDVNECFLFWDDNVLWLERDMLANASHMI